LLSIGGSISGKCQATRLSFQPVLRELILGESRCGWCWRSLPGAAGGEAEASQHNQEKGKNEGNSNSDKDRDGNVCTVQRGKTSLLTKPNPSVSHLPTSKILH
jgi:hypothetical protein